MEMILLHLTGDYITQTQWMASKKTSSSWVALVHSFVYAIPFLLIGSIEAVSIIFITHFFVDRFRLARFVVFAKNWITEPTLKWAHVGPSGYPKEVPVWLSTWLLIIVDNTIHLICNYLALTWF